MKNKFMILKRGLAAVLTAALVLTGLQAAMPERTVKKVEAADVMLKNPRVDYVEVEMEETDGTLKNPRIVADDSMKARQKVTWDCVYFGSYPQAEVIPSNVEYEDLYKSLRRDGDVIISDSVYASLQSASGWDENNDIILNGAKYRRMEMEDATYMSEADWDYYKWNSGTNYIYFKYEPIKWRVLRIDGNQALLLSDIVLDDQMYHTKHESVTWETSTLRSWLNGYGAGSNKQSVDYSQKNFIDSAFTALEREAIADLPLENEDNGNNTIDKIFLLSESDVWNTDIAKMYGFVENSVTNDEARRCQSSTYAKAMGVWSSRSTAYSGNGYWCLRSLDDYGKRAMYVGESGWVNEDGNDVSIDWNGIRPALNLKLSSSNLYTYAGTVCSKASAVRKVTWDCVWFGSYPQTEVIPLNVEYTALDASLRREGDVIASDSVYATLQSTSGWDANNDITLNGVKYRRMKREDAIYIDWINERGFYQWNNSTDYRYFKYEPIKWRVLRTSGNQALLLSDIVLDNQMYHAEHDYDNVTWETCTLRSWLNGYGAGSNKQSVDYRGKNFIGSAFTALEQEAIASTSLENTDSIDGGTKGGNDTTDKIFLLSESDVENTDTANAHGFVEDGNISDEARWCQSSVYAKAMGIESITYPAYVGNSEWWLRSTGGNGYCAMYVYRDGGVNRNGYPVLNRDSGVRPALTMNLSSSNLYTYAGTVCSDGTKEETGKDWGSPGIDDPAPSNPEQPETPTPGKPEEKAPGIGTKLTDAARKAVYKVTGAGKVEYTNSLKKKSSAVTVPEKVTLDGKSYQVTAIGNSAFKNCKKLKTVVIGKGVTSIGAKAFNGCKALKKITIKSTKLKKVGKNAFKGIHAKAVIKVPKAKLKAYQKLLKKKGQGKRVQIVK